MNDLTPREQAIVALALGRSPLDVARELDVPEAAVRRVGGLLGWPGDSRQLKRAASAIHAGQRLWAGELTERPDDVVPVGQAQPAPEVTDDEPDGCSDECGGGCSCHVGNSAPCNHCADNHDGIDVEPMPVPPDRYVFDDPRDSVECVACGAQVSRWSALAFEGRPFCWPCATATPNPNDQGDPMSKPCAHAAHHIAIGPDEVVEAGDRLTIDGLRGTAIRCPGCGFSALVLDPDNEQPGPSPYPDDADALVVLADVDKLTTRTDRAVLTMPLTRLVDLDGTETVLAEVVVEVRLVRPGVLAALDEDALTLDDAVEVESLERRLTPDGAAAIRALAALLPPGADR